MNFNPNSKRTNTSMTTAHPIKHNTPNYFHSTSTQTPGSSPRAAPQARRRQGSPDPATSLAAARAVGRKSGSCEGGGGRAFGVSHQSVTVAAAAAASAGRRFAVQAVGLPNPVVERPDLAPNAEAPAQIYVLGLGPIFFDSLFMFVAADCSGGLRGRWWPELGAAPPAGCGRSPLSAPPWGGDVRSVPPPGAGRSGTPMAGCGGGAAGAHRRLRMARCCHAVRGILEIQAKVRPINRPRRRRRSQAPFCCLEALSPTHRVLPLPMSPPAVGGSPNKNLILATCASSICFHLEASSWKSFDQHLSSLSTIF
jgi:hypothetical protein